jgi:hypothetical protein
LQTPTASGSSTPAGAVTPKQHYPIYGASYTQHKQTHLQQESLGNISTGVSRLISADPAQQAHPSVSPPSSSKPCPGVSVQWAPGSHWLTYPYLQHGVRAVGWEPIALGKDNTLQLRAVTCSETIPAQANAACIPCQTLPSSSKFQNFMTSAANLKPNTPWDYLSAEQQMKLMRNMAQTNIDLRVKVCQVRISANPIELITLFLKLRVSEAFLNSAISSNLFRRALCFHSCRA